MLGNHRKGEVFDGEDCGIVIVTGLWLTLHLMTVMSQLSIKHLSDYHDCFLIRSKIHRFRLNYLQEILISNLLEIINSVRESSSNRLK